MLTKNTFFLSLGDVILLFFLFGAYYQEKETLERRDVAFCNVKMIACAAAKLWEEAIGTLKIIRKSQRKPNVISSGATTRARVQTEKWAQASVQTHVVYGERRIYGSKGDDRFPVIKKYIVIPNEYIVIPLKRSNEKNSRKI
jgi:hypothetical protein